MRIRVLLGGHLRDEVPWPSEGASVELPSGACARDVIEMLGLSPSRVRMILINGRGCTPSSPVGEGDRVALFPPELSFNTFVSLNFRKERVNGLHSPEEE